MGRRRPYRVDYRSLGTGWWMYWCSFADLHQARVRLDGACTRSHRITDTRTGEVVWPEQCPAPEPKS